MRQELHKLHYRTRYTLQPKTKAIIISILTCMVGVLFSQIQSDAAPE